MKHYTRKVIKHFYVVTCPNCKEELVFDNECDAMRYKNGGWICEKCLKWFEDDEEFEEIEPPERKIKYKPYKGA